MNDLRKAAEMALEALETLWDILDDIDTASDMAKENDAWYRKRVEALQKKRWDTMITTDGHKLKGGPVEAIRQALAHEALDRMVAENQRLGLYDDGPAVKTYAGGKPNYCTPEVTPEVTPDVDNAYTKLDTTAGVLHKEWVGLTNEDIDDLWKTEYFNVHYELPRAIEAKLKEKNT